MDTQQQMENNNHQNNKKEYSEANLVRLLKLNKLISKDTQSLQQLQHQLETQSTHQEPQQTLLQTQPQQQLQVSLGRFNTPISTKTIGLYINSIKDK